MEITTSNPQCLCNVDTMKSNSTFASTFDSKFTSQHIMDVVMATSIQRGNRNVKFATTSRRRYYEVAPKLHQLCKERKM